MTKQALQKLIQSSKSLKKRSFFKRSNPKPPRTAPQDAPSVKLPNIYRIFTDIVGVLKKNWIHLALKSTVVLLFFLLVGSIIMTSITLYHNLEKKEKEENARQKVISQIYYWESVVKKYKDYRDGYYQLAVLEYQLGNMVKAREYIKKVLLLDPNFDEARKLEKLLGN